MAIGAAGTIIWNCPPTATPAGTATCIWPPGVITTIIVPAGSGPSGIVTIMVCIAAAATGIATPIATAGGATAGGGAGAASASESTFTCTERG